MFEANVVNTDFFCESEVTDLTDGVAVIRPSGEGSEGGAEQSWRFDRCFMLTGHGPSSALVDSVLSGDCAHDAESWESTTRPGCAQTTPAPPCLRVSVLSSLIAVCGARHAECTLWARCLPRTITLATSACSRSRYTRLPNYLGTGRRSRTARI